MTTSSSCSLHQSMIATVQDIIVDSYANHTVTLTDIAADSSENRLILTFDNGSTGYVNGHHAEVPIYGPCQDYLTLQNPERSFTDCLFPDTDNLMMSDELLTLNPSERAQLAAVFLLLGLNNPYNEDFSYKLCPEMTVTGARALTELIYDYECIDLPIGIQEFYQPVLERAEGASEIYTSECENSSSYYAAANEDRGN